MFQEAGHADLLANNVEQIVLEDYLSLYQSENGRHFVARNNGKIVASAGAFVKSDLPFRYFKESEYGFLGDVYTSPRYRGFGIATKLSKEALQWLQSRNIKMVRLLASEAARPIYESLGFKSTDEMAVQWKT